MHQVQSHRWRVYQQLALPTTPMATPIASSTTHAVAPGAPVPTSAFGTLECPERFTFGKYCYCNVHDDDSFEFRHYCSESMEIWGIGTAMMSNSQNAKAKPANRECTAVRNETIL
jgi:hypothetical protein